jgi:outer membrane lipoprotein carrier protein
LRSTVTALFLVVTAPAAGAAATLAAAPAAAPAATTAATPLDAYLDNLKTLRTSFLQTLTDSRGHEIDRATGTLVVQRPGKFRWDIHPQPIASGPSDAADAAASPPGGAAGGGAGAGQLMVCDGRNLWFFDRDLEQVTV